MRYLILAGAGTLGLAVSPMTALAQNTASAPARANALPGSWITDPQGGPPFGMIQPADSQPALLTNRGLT